MRAPFFLPIPALSTAVRTRRPAFAGGVFLIAWGVSAVAASTEQGIVSRVVDGDTRAVHLNGQPEKVRLIGIDTSGFHASTKLHREAIQSLNLHRILAPQQSDLPPKETQSGHTVAMFLPGSCGCGAANAG